MTTYELSSKKGLGSLKLGFVNGYLIMIEMDFKEPLNPDTFDTLMMTIPYQEDKLNVMTALGFTISEVLAPNKKIALFCAKYKEEHGIAYKASRIDGARIKEFKITEDILKHYFKSENFLFKGKHSITNLLQHYNVLLQEMKAADQPKTNHPKKYDREYESKLKGKDLSEYWAHLRGLGFKPVKDRFGNTVDWN